jgi:hypothetical protein
MVAGWGVKVVVAGGLLVVVGFGVSALGAAAGRVGDLGAFGLAFGYAVALEQALPAVQSGHRTVLIIMSCSR